jgi:putative ABC transport system ATP-binding protein
MAADPEPTRNNTVLRLEDVSKVFQMGEVRVEALRHVSLEIYAGEVLVLLGPSGSGKTTLLNLLGGMDTPSSGQIWYGQQELSRFSQPRLTEYRRGTIGFVFQFYNLVPNLTARENVMVSTEISDNPMDVDEALHLVKLDDRRDHFPSQLSGGEQQRVAIARAMAKDPDLLLCDEPTGALDFKTGKQVLGLLVDLKQKLGKTVVIITHNAAISQMADRTVRLRSGEVVEVTSNEHPTPPEEISW